MLRVSMTRGIPGRRAGIRAFEISSRAGVPKLATSAVMQPLHKCRCWEFWNASVGTTDEWSWLGQRRALGVAARFDTRDAAECDRATSSRAVFRKWEHLQLCGYCITADVVRFGMIQTFGLEVGLPQNV